MAAALVGEAGVHVVNAVVLNQVLVRFGSAVIGEKADRITQAVIARVQAGGVCFAGGAMWNGRRVMRLSIIGASMTEPEILRSWDAIHAAWRCFRDG